MKWATGPPADGEIGMMSPEFERVGGEEQRPSEDTGLSAFGYMADSWRPSPVSLAGADEIRGPLIHHGAKPVD
jgi:hypothetical protein